MDGTVQIHENRLDEYVDFINTNNFTDVYINDLGYSLHHINFLEHCPQIEAYTLVVYILLIIQPYIN